MNLELINVSIRHHEYYGNFTPQENKIIQFYAFGKILHLFSGKSNIGQYRVDFAFGNIKDDVFNILPKLDEYFDTIIIDAPYNKQAGNKYQKIGNTPEQFIIFASIKKTSELFNHVKRLNPCRIILKSWNYYIPKGYRLLKGYVCYAGGYRKPTFLLILTRNEK